MSVGALSRPTVRAPDPEDSETDTSDSLENYEDPESRPDFDIDNIAYENPIDRCWWQSGIRDADWETLMAEWLMIICYVEIFARLYWQRSSDV